MTTQEAVPEPFAQALASLHAVRLRPEVVLDEAPAPQRLAPYAVALTADVLDSDDELATGRFVLLHHPEGHETWDGQFRVVTFTRASLEPDMAADPLVTEVAWVWLIEALSGRGAGFAEESGTVTRVASESFGSIAGRPTSAEIEVRASWTPLDDDFGAHLGAWADLMCTAAGLPPMPPGVVPLSAARHPRLSR